MTFSHNTLFIEFKKIISKEIKIINEINLLLENLEKIKNSKEKKIVINQINSLKQSLKRINLEIPKILNRFNLPNSLIKSKQISKLKIKNSKENLSKIKPPKIKFSPLEKETLKRLKKRKQKIIKKKERKASKYVQISNKIFSKTSENILSKKYFKMLKSNLIKANLQFLPKSYFSVILFTTFLSICFAFFLFLFFLFFNISAVLPIITFATEGIASRFTKVFWILFIMPLGTFFMMYFYPSLEAKSSGNKINQELPFAAIHMSSIAGSMIDPSKIFSIILTTKEYPNIEKEFIKLLNEINLLGYDLVTALRNSAINCPSKKLSELFNGIATTINSGGNLAEFFSKRAESLLFEYRIEREKRTRSAETFMDIYISVVIAAPMILMLLLMMMKISGLGIQLSTSMITLIMVLGVTIINIGFLTFLHLKQSASG
ncbi:MAG: type II secretion system F family protein [Nanoarchaeota archaeon]